MEIAPLQREELDLLDNILAHLSDGVGRENRQTLTALRDDLAQWAARIAVIGQVKAGKSTFLNAFLHETDFLPSDVNPWTSVVTNIRINVRNDPRIGARFEFFSDSDWDVIINGTTELRALTERLLPGFDTEVLRRQTEEMRARAQARLGRHYHALLGKSHSYEFLNADLMQRYVCAGQGDEAPNGAQGRYALITKVANVFMRRPEFKIPVILTDTPGVNDPFLVRDEFTCRSLDKSDVFIMVLSAHQALTNVDLALIRLLARQSAKEVVIFINRIDELDNYASLVPALIEEVGLKLHHAVPEINFTILPGSAFMADAAMRHDPEAEAARAALDTPELHAYLQARLGYLPESATDRLLAASGLDDVKHALSTILDNGIGTNGLARIFEDTRAEVSALVYAMKRERESVQGQMDFLQGGNYDSALRLLEEEIATLTRMEQEIHDQVETTDAGLARALDKSWSGLERDLNEAITDFLEGQHREFKDQMLRQNVARKAARDMQVDLLPLHAEFEARIARHYTRSRAATDVILNNCLSSCQHAIAEGFDELLEGVTLADLPHAEFASTLTFAKKDLRVPLVSAPSWAFWRRATVSTERSIEAFRAILTAELRPVVEKIISAFNEAQVARATTGLDRIRVMQRMIGAAAEERHTRLRRDHREVASFARDSVKQAAVYGRLQSQLEVLERRVKILSVAQSALARVDLSDAA